MVRVLIIRLTVYGRQKPIANQPQDPTDSGPTRDKLNLIDQYLAFLLVILEEAGLFNVRVADLTFGIED